MNSSKFKCAIFDFDSLIEDTDKLSFMAINKILLSYGVEISLTHYQQYYRGLCGEQVIVSLFDKLDISYNLHELINEFDLIVRKIAKEKILNRLQPDLTLSYLKSKGYCLCLVSNTPSVRLHKIVEIAQLTDLFEGHVFSSDEINSCEMEPDLFLYAAMQMGVRLDECVVIHDTHSGLELSCQTGLTSIYVTNGKLENKPFKHPLARYVVNLKQAAELLTPSRSFMLI